MAWREEHYENIRSRLDRLDIRLGSLEAFVATGETAKGFNLSDIFEYMSPEVFEQVYFVDGEAPVTTKTVGGAQPQGQDIDFSCLLNAGWSLMQ